MFILDKHKVKINEEASHCSLTGAVLLETELVSLAGVSRANQKSKGTFLSGTSVDGTTEGGLSLPLQPYIWLAREPSDFSRTK